MTMGILDLLGFRKTFDWDKTVLERLRQHGSDLSKAHDIEFFLYFPSQAAAEKASRNIMASGFEVKVNEAAETRSWLCLATKTMVPDLAALQKIRRDFMALAESLDGLYDGWGTEVVK
jgi:regulator of RNase E activity RraB